MNTLLKKISKSEFITTSQAQWLLDFRKKVAKKDTHILKLIDDSLVKPTLRSPILTFDYSTKSPPTKKKVVKAIRMGNLNKDTAVLRDGTKYKITPQGWRRIKEV